MENTNQWNNILQIVCDALAFLMLFLAMLISTARTVHQAIPLYKVQSGVLALVTLITAFTFSTDDPIGRLFVFLFTIIPILLLMLIEPLLSLASVPEDLSTRERVLRLVRIVLLLMVKPLLSLIAWLGRERFIDRLPLMSSIEMLETARRKAYPVWLARQTRQRSSFWSILLDLLLIILAFNVAYTLFQDRPEVSNILAISFSLLLLGLSIMRGKQDIISQIMGLLIMEHGMFLAAIRLVPTLRVVIAFVVSLLLYIMITLTILVFLLPDLHRISGQIDISQQDQLKG